MTDRIVKVLENGRTITRGVNVKGSGFVLNADPDEVLPITFDWSGWLGTDTIASVANESHGPGISAASNTTTTATFTVSASSNGYIEHRITTAAGSVKEARLTVNSMSEGRRYADD
jgi:hypothetical protein